jgi:hypothetical protein
MAQRLCVESISTAILRARRQERQAPDQQSSQASHDDSCILVSGAKKKNGEAEHAMRRLEGMKRKQDQR